MAPASRFRKDTKILLVMALVVLAYVLSSQAGFTNTVSQPKTCRNGKQSLAVSVFGQGLSVLRSQPESLKRFMDYVEDRIRVLKTPKWLHVQ